jgi:hypothetical protein
MRAIKFLTCMLLAASLSGCITNGVPREVQAFVKKRDACDHFRGEVPDPGPDQAERMKEVSENIAELCTGTDAELRRLLVRYRKDSTVMEKLVGYDSLIEAPKKN